MHRPATASDGKTSMEVDIIDVLPTAVYDSQLQIPEAAGVSFTFPQGLPHFESAANTQPQEAATYVLVPGKGEQLDPRKKILAQYGVWELDSGKKRAKDCRRKYLPIAIPTANCFACQLAHLGDYPR